MTTSSSDNIKNPIFFKRFIPTSDTMGVLPIAEPLIEKLNIDEDTWFEEILTSEGIRLKISRSSDPLALPKRDKEEN